ncbi:citrate lyase holo-[acyl-carrier protein] synthase [Aerococcaceae bacterium DSM 111020]|nr:citrate lyase holo-[acyl-carrier protein] synthase [Aerococcaceae bacterium DSM 111020]
MDLITMLAAREERAQRQIDYLEQYPQASHLCVNLNIPGPIKQSEKLKNVFLSLMETIEQQLQGHIIHQEILHLTTGSTANIVVDLPNEVLKRRMITIEIEHPYGRLADLDVILPNDGSLPGKSPRSMSRTELGFPSRRCLICDQPAKECGRSRKHSLDTLTQTITQIINQKGRSNDERY